MNRKILLVNDDPAVRRMLFRVLTGENYVVATADRTTKPLWGAMANDVDVLLLDVDSADKPGWQHVETLSRQNNALPIVVLSDRPELVAKPPRVSAILEKPPDVQRLLQTIRDLIAGRAEVHAK